MYRILLVEGNKELGESYKDSLEKALNVKDSLETALNVKVDLVPDIIEGKIAHANYSKNKEHPSDAKKSYDLYIVDDPFIRDENRDIDKGKTGLYELVKESVDDPFFIVHSNDYIIGVEAEKAGMDYFENYDIEELIRYIKNKESKRQSVLKESSEA